MALLVLGLAAMAGGVVAWTLFRNTAQLPGQGKATDSDTDGVVDAPPSPGEIASAPSVNMNTSGVTQASTAEGNDTIPQRADEGEDRFESSPAASLGPTLERWTADVFLDEEVSVPTVQFATRVVDDAVADSAIAYVYDDIVSPRDLADAPVAGEMGMLETELK